MEKWASAKNHKHGVGEIFHQVGTHAALSDKQGWFSVLTLGRTVTITTVPR